MQLVHHEGYAALQLYTAMHSRDALISAFNNCATAPSSHWSVTEIATFVDENLHRVRSHFDKYRNSFLRPVNNPTGGQRRLYTSDTLQHYILFLTLCNELQYRAHQAEAILLRFDRPVLWSQYTAGTSALAVFLFDNRPAAV